MKHTILFLAANPEGTDRLALDREAHAIFSELKRSGYRERFVFETRWAVEPLDLIRELRELKPTVVHFSGQGGQHGLYFQATEGHAQLIAPAALAELFGAIEPTVKLVVLSSCYSEPQAHALLAYIDHVVGIVGSTNADAARLFAIGFYGGLGEHQSIAAAFKQGQTAIALHGLTDTTLPQLKVRTGVDAARLILASNIPLESEKKPPCPYPGMQPYTTDTATYFFGRSKEVEELVSRLHAGEREMYVIGPSGSGKTSFVAAGLLPRLEEGVSGFGRLVVRSMRPGDHPTSRLCEVLGISEAPETEFAILAKATSAALAHQTSDARLLLIIDQFEELFTLASKDECSKFLDMLRELRAEPRCILVIVLRADFYGTLMESRLWSELHGHLMRIDIAPLRGTALREAIERPAHEVAVSFEAGLVERLVADASSELGVLPLLQETLKQLWDRQQHRQLTLAAYEALGENNQNGLGVAIAHLADAMLRKLSLRQQKIARRVLLRLVSFGEGRSDTRRQQTLAALRGTEDKSGILDDVIKHLIDHRLLTIDEGRIDLAHEVLLTAWPILANWIRACRTDELRRRQLESSAAQWIERGRNIGGLLVPTELAEVEAWRQTDAARELGDRNDVEEFIKSSRMLHTRQRRRRMLFLAGTVILACSLAGGMLALRVALSNLSEQHKIADIIAIDEETGASARVSHFSLGSTIIVNTRFGRSNIPFDLRIYRNETDLAARCPSGPHCLGSEGSGTYIKFKFETPGEYQIVLVKGETAFPLDVSLIELLQLANNGRSLIATHMPIRVH